MMKAWGATVAAIMVLAAVADGATNAVDTAEAYEGWADGSTGGVEGFGAWSLQTTSTNVAENGHFIGDSTVNGFGTNAVPDNDINTSGKAWGMYANSDQTASAVRPFLGGALLVGQTVACAMDNGFVDGGTVGLALQNAQGENVLEVYFRGGQANYEVNDGEGQRELAFGYTTDGVVVRLTLTSYATYEGSIAAYPAGVPTSFSGTLRNPVNGPLITQVRFFVFNAGGGTDHDQFFNTLEVTEAPAPGPAQAAPRVAEVAVTNGEFVVSWSATNTVLYDLQSSTDLVADVWMDVPGASSLVSFGDALSVTNAAPTPVFYRIWQRES